MIDERDLLLLASTVASSSLLYLTPIFDSFSTGRADPRST